MTHRTECLEHSWKTRTEDGRSLVPILGMVALAGIPAQAAADGSKVGAAAAKAILELRTGDGWERPFPPLVLPNLPGYWKSTPPNNPTAGFTNYPDARGFIVENGRRFLPEGPPALTSARYANGLWRPVTAVREADTDGNDATQADPTWLPLLTTPLSERARQHGLHRRSDVAGDGAPVRSGQHPVLSDLDRRRHQPVGDALLQRLPSACRPGGVTPSTTCCASGDEQNSNRTGGSSFAEGPPLACTTWCVQAIR